MGKKKDTRLNHTGRDPHANFGIVNPPIYHASTILYPTLEEMEKAAGHPHTGVYYGRWGTPTSFALEEAMAELEGGDKGIATCSGLAAIAGALLSCLQAGDHLLMVDNVYAPSRRLCDGLLKRFGVETTYYDPMIGGGIKDLIQPNTKVVFTESPGSLTFEVPDIPALADAAHSADCLVMLDNTWSAGYFFQPFEHGVDISIQAITKYVSGHSDIMMGSIVTPEKLYERIKKQVAGLGYSAAPDDCYLALRGLRTLGPRLRQHQETGLKLARWLQQRAEVKTVLHPAQPDCPGHDIWKRDFTGASGLFSMIIDETPKEALAAMLDGFELFGMGYSWGGYESLMIPSDPAQIRTATPWPGTGTLLRLHAGLEDADDLIADLEAGFERLNAMR
ncbi:MAG: cystathionine beta-lyase [Rhodospirillales bacterium]|nr:cystathionine beta-lyase [Rhodospirillales bacterium]